MEKLLRAKESNDMGYEEMDALEKDKDKKELDEMNKNKTDMLRGYN